MFTLLIILLALLMLAFEIWMLVDAIQNPRLKNNERWLWAIGIVLVHPIVAIVYYFMVYQKSA